jgi:CheY-like chemotaxis protein
MHALIIEDEPLVAMVIENMLRDHGYTSFAFAVSADEAVAAALGKCPDLITSDVMLGTSNGIDAVQEICSRKQLAVVFVTSSANQVQERLPEYSIVQKPFSADDLMSAVQKASLQRSARPTACKS